MKYMMLTFGSERDYQNMVGQPSGDRAWTKEDYSALGAFMRSLSQELLDSGELVETSGLGAPVHSRRIRLEEGARW